MKRIIPVVFAAIGAAAGFYASSSSSQEHTRTVTIAARQYAFEPPRIRVEQGDEVRLRLYSKDVVHGFFLEGYDIDATITPQQRLVHLEHPSSGKPAEQVEEIVFRADRRGKYRYRCSHTCGTMHPFMTGELIVGPNSTLHAGLGGVLGLVAGLFVFMAAGGGQGKRHEQQGSVPA